MLSGRSAERLQDSKYYVETRRYNVPVFAMSNTPRNPNTGNISRGKNAKNTQTFATGRPKVVERPAGRPTLSFTDFYLRRVSATVSRYWIPPRESCSHLRVVTFRWWISKRQQSQHVMYADGKEKKKRTPFALVQLRPVCRARSAGNIKNVIGFRKRLFDGPYRSRDITVAR